MLTRGEIFWGDLLITPNEVIDFKVTEGFRLIRKRGKELAFLTKGDGI
jgi:hypothetical protein